MNSIAKRWIFSAWVTIALLAQLSAAGAEDPAFFGKVDTELRAALENPPGPKMVQHLNVAEELLVAGSKERRSSQSGTDLEVNARATIIDAMRNVSGLEQAGNTLDAVRALSKVLELARSLGDMTTGSVGKSKELDHLVSAIYRHLQKVAASDRTAPVAFNLAPGETLLFRIFVLPKKTQLAAFELGGNAALRSANWRETQFRASPAAAMSAVESFLRSSEGGKAEKFAEQPPFVMLLSGALAVSDFGVEQQMQRTAKELLRRGIVLIVLNSKELDRPYTLLPAIDGADAFVDLRATDAVLIYRKTASELYRWNRLSSAAELNRAAAVAQELAAEIYQDIEAGRSPAFLDQADLKLFVAAASRPHINVGKQFAVTEPLQASVVDANDKIALKPTTTLVLAAMGPPGWGQYSLQGGNEVVWLRTSQVAPFKAEPKETGGEADKKTPKEDKGQKGLWDRWRGR